MRKQVHHSTVMFPAAFVFALAFAGASLAQAQHRQSVEQMIDNWPKPAREAATFALQKYGSPDSICEDRLIWRSKGPWREMIVYREPVPHDFPKEHEDVFEQVIDYRVPIEKYSALAAFDGSIIVERTKGTMAARCDKEEMNFLALNLAHDIVRGNKSVEQAREAYAQIAMAFMKGEKHPYTQKLQFNPPASGADPDKPAKN